MPGRNGATVSLLTPISLPIALDRQPETLDFHFPCTPIGKIKYPRVELTVMARPFLKWAGGKRQLIPEIEARLPADIDECTTYVEPFVGGGAVLFHLLETRRFDEVHISDLNPELVLCYRALQADAQKVIEHLSRLVDAYPAEQDDRKVAFYGIRDEWNSKVGGTDALSEEEIAERTAQTLFLNKTCFNGLFRVNRKGEFNGCSLMLKLDEACVILIQGFHELPQQTACMPHPGRHLPPTQERVVTTLESYELSAS